VIAFHDTPDGDFTVAKARIDAFKPTARHAVDAAQEVQVLTIMLCPCPSAKSAPSSLGWRGPGDARSRSVPATGRRVGAGVGSPARRSAGNEPGPAPARWPQSGDQMDPGRVSW
jgi:hypothetical protein